jgi:hypothetical protein
VATTTVRRTARWRAIALRAVLAGALSFAGVELVLRWALFSSGASALPLVERLRIPRKYAHPQFDDLYWELNDQFLRAKGDIGLAPRDERLGWTSSAFAPATYVHEDAPLALEKRPVLLFGDSYAMGITAPQDSFQTLFALSPLARDHVLLNFGVGGYGLDQMLLLLPRVLDDYEGRDPLVVIGVLVDDDLDRCTLTLREQPKPSFELVDGALVLREDPLPTPLERYARGPTPTPSYLWRYLTRTGKLLPKSVRDSLADYAARDRRKEQLARTVLAQMLGELEKRGFERLFVLFHNWPSLVDRGRCGWRDAALREPLKTAGIPIVDMREVMLETAARTGENLQSYFDNRNGPGGHFNARGNEIAFEALERALCERLGRPHEHAPLSVRDARCAEKHGVEGSVEFQATHHPLFPEARDRPRLALRVGAGGPTRVEFELGGRARRLDTGLKFAQFAGETRGSVELSFVADGELLERRTLRRADAAPELSIDLRGRQRLEIVVTDAGDGHASDWIALTRPRFE